MDNLKLETLFTKKIFPPPHRPSLPTLLFLGCSALSILACRGSSGRAAWEFLEEARPLVGMAEDAAHEAKYLDDAAREAKYLDAARAAHAAEADDEIVTYLSTWLACGIVDGEIEPTEYGIRSALAKSAPDLLLELTYPEMAQVMSYAQVIAKVFRGDQVKYDSICGLR